MLQPGAIVTTDGRSIGGHNLTGLQHFGGIALKKITVIVAGEKTQVLRICPRSSRQAKVSGETSYFGLGKLTHREKRAGKLILFQDMQNIRLIFRMVNRAKKFYPSSFTRSVHPSHVMPRRHKLSAKGKRMVQKKRPADLTIA